MKTGSVALLGSALLAGTSLAHNAIMPPMPDKALTPNSTDAPAGCKLLSSDKGWPSDSYLQQTFPGAYKKLKGTYGPDWMVQAKTVGDVQKAVNVAREKNIRLTLISTGHDFLGRQTARSGLRLDLNSMREPTVFTNEWKCGDTLRPVTHQGKNIDFEDVVACRVSKNKSKRSSIPGRDQEYHYFEKRDGMDCDQLMRLKKRQMDHGDMQMPKGGPGEPSHAGGTGALPVGVKTHNVIKPIPGKQAYARVSGGMYNEMFFMQAADSGLMTLGAQHGGVSVTGGWMQAGGHNPFANKFGMQVDNVVEIEVVTADGKFQKVSECNNPELFWALRGGGGSTFGVVTGLTVKVFPTFPVTVSRFFVNSTNKAGILDATAWFLQNGAKLRDNNGLQGYFYVYPGSFSSVLHMPDEFSKIENAKNVTEYALKNMEKLAGAKAHIEPKYYTYKTYRDWYVGEMGSEEGEEKGETYLSYFDGSDGSVPSAEEAMMNPLRVIPWSLRDPQYPMRKRSIESAEHAESMYETDATMQEATIMRSQPLPRHYLDSTLLSDQQVNSVSTAKLVEAMNASMPNAEGIHWRGFLYGGGEMAKKDPASTGLLPQWRNATFHFIINGVPGAVRHDYNVQSFRKLFPDAGAYVNEASHEDPEWKKVFWGTHYDKLESIKKKVDPSNVFWCSPCVGSDALTYDDERICTAKDYPQAGPSPQTWPNAQSKTGISSLPGIEGIPHPLMPVIEEWGSSGKLPPKMLNSAYFKIAMGEGGSAGGRFKDMDPYKPGSKLAKPWGS